MESGTSPGRPQVPESKWKNIFLECPSIFGHLAAIATEIKIPKELGGSKHKRVPWKLADALNGCLCKLILNSLMKEVLKCKQAGCKNRWVSTSYYECWFILKLTLYVLVSSSMCRTWARATKSGVHGLWGIWAGMWGEAPMLMRSYIETCLIRQVS